MFIIILCLFDCAWGVRLAEPEFSVSSPCTFAKAYICPTLVLLLFLPLRPLPTSFVECDPIDIQNMRRFPYLDQYPSPSLRSYLPGTGWS